MSTCTQCLLTQNLPRTWRFQTTTKIVGSITDFTPAKSQKKRTCWIRFQVWGNFGLLWYFKNPFAAVLQPQRNHHGTCFSFLGSHRRKFLTFDLKFALIPDYCGERTARSTAEGYLWGRTSNLRRRRHEASTYVIPCSYWQDKRTVMTRQWWNMISQAK